MMEESDQLKHKSVLDEFTADGINIEDVQYSALREDLELDARDFEAPTWSLSVDQEYMRKFSKEAVKRQDVIHELIQTEINHVRTLKLMLIVYLRELRDSLLMDDTQLERLFPRLDSLLQEHHKFLVTLKDRRNQNLETGHDRNYCIRNIGDILITQFSGDLRNRLQDSYSVFCSHHTDAMNFYKELQTSKKFQNLIRRIGQLSIVRRLGIPEGILLITQRITKYPVLVERIIKNTEVGTREYDDLVDALECIKETISSVDTQVHQYEQLREICAHLEPKSFGRMSNGKMFGREDLLQNDRKLLREGVLTWRPQNRSKVLDIIMVLLPDFLLLLQEKDQKYLFASLDGKPAVLPLQKLIVREAAHSDRALYLISASDVKADLYEFHTSTAAERSSWRQQIWNTIEKCPHMEEALLEHEDVYPNKIRETHDQLVEKDAQIEEILSQKLQMFSDLSVVLMENSTTARRLLLRGSAPELLQGELFINNAIIQAETLQMQMIDEENSDVKLCIKSQTLPAFNAMSKSGDGFRSKQQRPNSDPHLRGLYLHLESSGDDDEGCTMISPAARTVKAEWIETADKLIRTLYSLKALVSLQDSELEVVRAALAERERPSRQRFSSIQDQERHRYMEKQREELLHLQKLHEQQQQEHQSWARERQRHLLRMHEHEQELNRRREECNNKEAWLRTEREVLSQNRGQYQQDLERLRECFISVEKEREKLEQELKRIRKHKNITHLGGASNLNNVHVPIEHPPLAPPRKESISMTASIKDDVPIHLLSTTNEALASSSIQQQIPTKLAISKGKERNKSKNSHHHANSADVYQEYVLNPMSPVPVTVPQKPAAPHDPQRPQTSSKEDIIYF